MEQAARASTPPNRLEQALRWLPRSTTLDGAIIAALAFLAVAATVAATAAAFGAFRLAAPLLLVSLALGAGAIAWASSTKRLRWSLDRIDVAAAVLAIAFGLFQGALHHEHLAAESDVGFYANDAALMASTGGRLLDERSDPTLPGMDAGPKGTRFAAMFGYSALGALFAVVGGTAALYWINAPLLALTALALYRVGRHVSGTIGPLIGTLFWATSYVTLWLGRYVMTENAATCVFWVSALAVLILARRWDPLVAAALVVAQTWGALVRPEGIVVAGWFAAVLAFLFRRQLWSARHDRPRVRAWIRSRVNAVFLGSLLFAFIVLAVMIGLRALPLVYLAASWALAARVADHGAVPDSYNVPVDLAPAPAEPPTPGEPVSTATWNDYILRYEWDSAVEYHIPWFLLLIALGLAFRIAPWRRVLGVVALALPYTLFLLMPPVTTAQPWYMRRLWIAFLPLVYLLAGLMLDPKRLAWRWPQRRRRTQRPRWDTAIVAGILALFLAVPHLDLVQSVFARHEDDGTSDLLPAVGPLIPPGSLVLVDQDLVGYSTPLRVQYDHAVVTWYQSPAKSFSEALVLGENHTHVFLLGLNVSFDIAILETDAEGATHVHDFRVRREGVPGNALLTYIGNPPLQQGYRPFRVYLDRALPPDRWESERFGVSLIELKKPIVLQKNIYFGLGWERTARGLEAVWANATIDLNASLFKRSLIETSPFALYVGYLQTTTGNLTISAARTNQTTPLEIRLPSDGSGTLRIERVPLPIPMDVERFLVPSGFVMRGIYFGLLE